MKPLAGAAVVVLLLAVVAGCGSEAAEKTAPSTPKTLSDVPPPLVPAMDLPENAVENAVAKLDGIAEGLMKESGIPGMADDEAFTLLGELFDYATQPKYMYRHKWCRGDMVIWDNRSVLHQATTDYDMNEYSLPLSCAA